MNIIKILKKYFLNNELRIYFIFFILIILLLISIFINDFNLLKIFNIIILIFISLGLYFYFQLQAKPQKEKIVFFDLIQNLLNVLNEGIVIYDDNLKIVFSNKAFSDFVGLKIEDLINVKVTLSMIKNRKYEMLANIFFPFIQGQNLKILNQQPETIEVEFTSPQEKYFLITYIDVYLDKKYRLRIVLDKTETILESQKKIEFLQLASHNLLTPLSELRWNLEAINLEKLSDEDKKSIQLALRIVRNTVIFVESILTLAKTEVGNFKLIVEEIDIEQIFIFILDLLRDKIEDKKLKINIEIEEGSSLFPGDKSFIVHAFFALIENAILYNKTGGSINIKVQRQKQRPYLEVEIEDTGIGMTEEDLKNLFKKYYRGQKIKEMKVEGFGIGLYNAKSIINYHGGEIKIESKENQGTTVRIYLPLDSNLINKKE